MSEPTGTSPHGPALAPCLSRRRFLHRLSQATGCALTLPLLQACEVAELTPVEGGTYAFDLIALPDLAKVGGFAAIAAGSTRALLIRLDQATVLAFDHLCPHFGLPMEPGKSTWDGKKLTCQHHASEFGADGAYLGGAFVPWSGKERGLTVYDVVFDASSGKGTVTVGGLA